MYVWTSDKRKVTNCLQICGLFCGQILATDSWTFLWTDPCDRIYTLEEIRDKLWTDLLILLTEFVDRF